jgi:hypothetical protein
VNRSRNRTSTVLSLGLASLLCAGLAACGTSDGAAASGAAATGTPTSTPTPTPTPEPVSVLSGRPGTDGPVLALKIDNTAKSLPHIGLTEADVVYVQQVEGGLTRLAAVYSSELPSKVAPIRSARETDAELLPMYGEIAFGFSGSVAGVHRLVTRAGLVDVSADRGPRGYSRLSSRPAPYNEAAVPETLIDRADGSVPARDVGFTFGKAPTGGTKAVSVTALYPAARISMRYNSATKEWAYWLGSKQDRSSQGVVAASTVIVQSVRLTTTGRDDVAGNPVPLSRTVGTGKATVLRDGRSWPVTWSRKSVGSPTRWTYQGKDFPMKAGQVWVLLLDSRKSATIATK